MEKEKFEKWDDEIKKWDDEIKKWDDEFYNVLDFHKIEVQHHQTRKIQHVKTVKNRTEDFEKGNRTRK